VSDFETAITVVAEAPLADDDGVFGVLSIDATAHLHYDRPKNILKLLDRWRPTLDYFFVDSVVFNDLVFTDIGTGDKTSVQIDMLSPRDQALVQINVESAALEMVQRKIKDMFKE